MQYSIIILRLLHIFGGVFWVGAAAVYYFFLAPTAALAAPESGKFMHTLMARRRFPVFMNIASATTVLSGAIMLWLISGGLGAGFLSTAPGLGLTVASAVALVGYVIGGALIGPTAKKMDALRSGFGPTGPTPQQRAELAALDRRMFRATTIELVLLLLALLGMSVARYL